MSVKLSEIVEFLDKELSTNRVPDYPVALNGLQVENEGEVTHVCVAVDASEKALKEAVARGADLLVVHHGMFWGGLQALTGAWRRKVKFALDNNLAVYSSHIPLDIHPTLGNNAEIARLCDLTVTGEGMDFKNGYKLGFVASYEKSLNELITRLETVMGTGVDAYLQQNGEENPASILVCSGGGGDMLAEAATKGVKTFIVGEGAYWNISMAEELGVNLIYAGHYETEVFGVQALGRLLEEKYKLPVEFLPLPPKTYGL